MSDSDSIKKEPKIQFLYLFLSQLPWVISIVAMLAAYTSRLNVTLKMQDNAIAELRADVKELKKGQDQKQAEELRDLKDEVARTRRILTGSSK